MHLAPTLALAVLVSLVPSAHGARLRSVPPIVFSSNRSDGDLVVQRADGSLRRVVTPGTRNDSSPAWSPDGTRIAFTEFAFPRTSIHVLDLRTGRVRFIGEGANPNWSPDGRQLVFVAFGAEPDLATMDANGANRRLLGVGATRVHDRTKPGWSPRGGQIAFVGRQGLFVVNADGSELRRISTEGTSGRASWSPSGRRIAFDCSTNLFAVCTVRPNGSGLRGLTPKGHFPSWSPRGNLIALSNFAHGTTVLVRPSGSLVRELRARPDIEADWAPDGKRLVVSHDPGIDARLYATNAGGSALTRLTQGYLTNDAAPAWSPDGRRIAFRRRLFGHCSLEVLDVRTGRLRELARRRIGRHCEDRPDWSRDGRRILYSLAGDLWVVNSRGGRPRRVTRSQVAESNPRWAPDSRSIGFVTRTGIWVRHPNGRRRLLIPRAGPFAWSHDGGALAYVELESPTGSRFLYVQEGAQPPRRIFEDVSGPPSWSPDDSRLVFVHVDFEANNWSLFVTDLEGRGREIVGDDPSDPDWRP